VIADRFAPPGRPTPTPLQTARGWLPRHMHGCRGRCQCERSSTSGSASHCRAAQFCFFLFFFVQLRGNATRIEQLRVAKILYSVLLYTFLVQLLRLRSSCEHGGLRTPSMQISPGRRGQKPCHRGAIGPSFGTNDLVSWQASESCSRRRPHNDAVLAIVARRSKRRIPKNAHHELPSQKIRPSSTKEQRGTPGAECRNHNATAGFLCGLHRHEYLWC
jgi:hypothetical protein